MALTDWKQVVSLGRGGQGEVFLVERPVNDLQNRLTRAILNLTGVHTAQEKAVQAEAFADLIREIGALQKGALKKLHPAEAHIDARVALERMKREVAVLQSIEHPAITRILEVNLEERWFVMEFCSGQSLNSDLTRTKGDALHALRRLRPVVEAVSLLHTRKLVHRDIKPKNILARENGELVLADLGIVIGTGGDEPRVTDVYDNPGSRDWMPGWVMGKTRIEEVRPSFDVFTLGKILWCMVAGEHGLPLWYYDRPENDLRQLFPGNREIPWVVGILSKSVREHETDCLQDGQALLKEFDTAIEAIERGGQKLSRSTPHKCRVCGVGTYSHGLAESEHERRVACSHCGHIQTFVWKNKPGWEG